VKAKMPELQLQPRPTRSSSSILKPASPPHARLV
jgi:hypothetical protein